MNDAARRGGRPAGTDPAREWKEQKRWRLRPNYARLGWFDRLLANEFLPAAEQTTRADALLASMARFAATQVPHYRELFKRLGLAPDAVRRAADLGRLPMLTRAEVQDRPQRLRPARLPEGHAVAGESRTSGTTGQPVRVDITVQNLTMFAALKQRELRWFRFDPKGLLGAIRAAPDITAQAHIDKVENKLAYKMQTWPQVGAFFETGPYVAFSNANALDDQVALLEEAQPDYLIALSADLEQLAFAFQDRPRPARLRGTEAISQQLTEAMRGKIESVFGVPVHENYGLNEFGLIATRCPEGGRYHVHTEHCIVEIVDEEGRPCRPGETGRVLVSGLLNTAMPLLRYDADDLAEPAEGPCPCGRTLPSFAALHGRYRRTAYLPPGTWAYWAGLQLALYHMPQELVKPLRQYQLHQYRDGRFELRLASARPLAPAFMERLREAWAASADGEPAPLAIREVDEIPRPPNSKFQDFTSDFTPPADERAGGGRDAGGPGR